MANLNLKLTAQRQMPQAQRLETSASVKKEEHIRTPDMKVPPGNYKKSPDDLKNDGDWTTIKINGQDYYLIVSANNDGGVTINTKKMPAKDKDEVNKIKNGQNK